MRVDFPPNVMAAREPLCGAARDVFDRAMAYAPTTDPDLLAVAVGWIRTSEVDRYYGVAAGIANAVKYLTPIIAEAQERSNDDRV